MTIDETLDRAARDLDVVLAKRWGALLSQLLDDGCDSSGAMAAVAEQQRVDREWKRQTLIAWNEWLVAEAVLRD
jgi:hypothetical protein